MHTRVSILLVLFSLAAPRLSAQRGEVEALALAPPPGAGPVVIRGLPFVITHPGRYLLAGNLTAKELPARGSQHGLVVRADDVEIDLGGWSLVGAKGTGTGILVLPPDKRSSVSGLVIRNGTLRQWGGLGIEASLAELARWQDLHVAANGFGDEAMPGARAGAGAIIDGCSFFANAAHGLVAKRGAIVTRSTATRNAGDGFQLAELAVLRDCTAFENSGDGFGLDGAGALARDCASGRNEGSGFRALTASHLSGCTSVQNGGGGVLAGQGALVTDTLIANNRGTGLVTFLNNNRMQDNHVVDNGYGLEIAGRGNVARSNTLSGNGRSGQVGPRNPWATLSDSPADDDPVPAPLPPLGWVNAVNP